MIQNRVYSVRKKLNRKQPEGAEIDDSFGSLSTFAADKVWSESVRRHNDSADVFHISQFDTVVLGSETSPEFDIFRMTLSSPWMLANALRAISAGWVFQLNADGTPARFAGLVLTYSRSASIRFLARIMFYALLSFRRQR